MNASVRTTDALFFSFKRVFLPFTLSVHTPTNTKKGTQMPARAASPSLLPQTVKYARIKSPPTLSTATMSSLSSTSSSLPRLLVSLDSSHPKAQAPTRGSAQAAGYDLYASEETTIPKSGRAMVATGIRLAIPLGCYGRVAPRSGLGECLADRGNP